MGLISYTNLEDGTPITANIFNERFGQIISVLNGGLDQNNFANGGIPASALQSSVFEKIYPVGSLYYNATDNTDPATLLGFGTWTQFAAGRVPVGYDSSNTNFDAAEKTGGSETETLTEGQIPAHNHSVDPPSATTSSAGAHTHTYWLSPNWTTGAGAGHIVQDIASKANQGRATSSAGAHTHTLNIPAFNSGNKGGGGSHNNLQPYVTVYIWKRTA